MNYVLKHNFKYDGAFTSIIESPALTEQEIKTKQDISLVEALKNTQTIEDATRVFMTKFERPNAKYANYDKRL